MDGCKQNPENLSTTEVSEQSKCIENKHDLCRTKDCMKRFGESLREHVMKTINFKNKKLSSFTKEQHELFENAKICCICKDKFQNKYFKDKKYP